MSRMNLVLRTDVIIYSRCQCVLVKGWKSSAAWGFPKGKINQQESERDCAVREVLEETGFDCGSLLSSDSADFMELTMREQKIRLYIVPGVDEETHFETLTRKEISRIAWFRLSDLPTWKKNKAPPQGMGGKFYLISPFVGKLKQWIQQNRSTVSHISNSITTELPIAAKSSHSSDELKNLLGLGNGGEMARGPQMIEEQGDARSRQLLDLLRGDVMSDEKENTIASSSSPQPQILDERDRGTAQLLTALNVGAGKEAQVMKKDDDGSNSAMLLSMLKGGDTSAPIPRQDERVFAPLSAPQAHNTSHAQSLLNLISPSHSNTSFISSDPLDKERERARQRDALLSNLMASSKISSPSIQKPMHDARIAQDFHFPPAGSNFGQHISSPAMPTSQESNLLSLLQPPNASKEAPAPAQSPFSSFVQQQTQATAAAPSQSAHIPQDTNNDSTKLLNLLNSRLSQNGNTNSSIFQPPDMISPPMPLFQAGYGPPFPQMAPSSYLPYPGGYPSGLSQHAAPAPFHPIPPPHAPLFYGSTPGHPSHQPTN